MELSVHCTKAQVLDLVAALGPAPWLAALYDAARPDTPYDLALREAHRYVAAVIEEVRSGRRLD